MVSKTPLGRLKILKPVFLLNSQIAAQVVRIVVIMRPLQNITAPDLHTPPRIRESRC